MKKRMYIGMLLAVMGIVACTGNKNTAKNDDTRVLLRDSMDSHGIRRMQVSEVEQTITFKGKEYRSFVQRMPGDSLPRVKNEAGEVFVDNVITLRLTRGNEKIFNKTFTKQSFSSFVSGEFMKHAILEGMVFDKITSQGFVYAVSVSYPQTDLYIPVSVTITPDGKMSMVKEELMEDIYIEEEE
ncbi:MAG: DUF4738 domain-containing protein [Mediterranea sp.]|jgi:hypothetical protein|nr:DUF4738 domain-containing protein [Mediterranea sp.]